MHYLSNTCPPSHHHNDFMVIGAPGHTHAHGLTIHSVLQMMCFSWFTGIWANPYCSSIYANTIYIYIIYIWGLWFVGLRGRFPIQTPLGTSPGTQPHDKAQGDLWIKTRIIQRLISDEQGYPLDNDPKLHMGQSNSRLKKFIC